MRQTLSPTAAAETAIAVEQHSSRLAPCKSKLTRQTKQGFFQTLFFFAAAPYSWNSVQYEEMIECVFRTIQVLRFAKICDYTTTLGNCKKWPFQERLKEEICGFNFALTKKNI